MRYSEEERRTHVALWQESGLSKAAYCREADIPYQSFVGWTHRCQDVVRDERPHAGDGNDEGAFIQLAGPRPGLPASHAVHVELAERGISISFRADVEAERIAAIIAQVAPAC